jgi:rod shape determining protein RodA
MRNHKLVILILLVVISSFGLLSIYSSTYQKDGQPWDLIFKRQLLWFALGLILFFTMANINYRRLWDWTYILYGLTIVLLLLVLVLGVVRLGAQRWLKFAWINFQPSELAKLITVIFLARYFSSKSADHLSYHTHKFGLYRALVLPFIFIAIPMGLIVEQPDLGSGIILLFIFIVMFYLAGAKLKYMLFFLLITALAIPVFWRLLKDYQKDRIMVFLNPNSDPLGAGYTIIQSKIAIGSGGFLGKGWLSGTQSQLHFLPESHTDFVFATFAEEWGFLGSIVLLSIYYFLITEGIAIGKRTSDNFGRLLALGISAMLGIQILVNIAMNMGIAPVVGLPLPLMSYGGSSILITCISLGILVNIGKTRAVF